MIRMLPRMIGVDGTGGVLVMRRLIISLCG